MITKSGKKVDAVSGSEAGTVDIDQLKKYAEFRSKLFRQNPSADLARRLAGDYTKIGDHYKNGLNEHMSSIEWYLRSIDCWEFVCSDVRGYDDLWEYGVVLSKLGWAYYLSDNNHYNEAAETFIKEISVFKEISGSGKAYDVASYSHCFLELAIVYEQMGETKWLMKAADNYEQRLLHLKEAIGLDPRNVWIISLIADCESTFKLCVKTLDSERKGCSSDEKIRLKDLMKRSRGMRCEAAKKFDSANRSDSSSSKYLDCLKEYIVCLKNLIEDFVRDRKRNSRIRELLPGYYGDLYKAFTDLYSCNNSDENLGKVLRSSIDHCVSLMDNYPGGSPEAAAALIENENWLCRARGHVRKTEFSEASPFVLKKYEYLIDHLQLFDDDQLLSFASGIVNWGIFDKQIELITESVCVFITCCFKRFFGVKNAPGSSCLRLTGMFVRYIVSNSQLPGKSCRSDVLCDVCNRTVKAIDSIQKRLEPGSDPGQAVNAAIMAMAINEAKMLPKKHAMRLLGSGYKLSLKLDEIGPSGLSSFFVDRFSAELKAL